MQLLLSRPLDVQYSDLVFSRRFETEWRLKYDIFFTAGS